MLLIFLGAGIATPPSDPRGRAGGSTELLSMGGVGSHLLSRTGGANAPLSGGGVDTAGLSTAGGENDGLSSGGVGDE